MTTTETIAHLYPSELRVGDKITHIGILSAMRHSDRFTVEREVKARVFPVGTVVKRPTIGMPTAREGDGTWRNLTDHATTVFSDRDIERQLQSGNFVLVYDPEA